MTTQTNSGNESPVFTVYWNNGQRSQIYGNSFAEALANAKLSLKDNEGMAFYRSGVDDTFGWNPIKKDWELHDMHYYGYD